ncbi:MAG: vWA domain-containing protein [Myxococcota bacterium]
MRRIGLAFMSVALLLSACDDEQEVDPLCTSACTEGGLPSLSIGSSDLYLAESEAEKDRLARRCAVECSSALHTTSNGTCPFGPDDLLRCADACGWQDCPESACLPEVRSMMAMFQDQCSWDGDGDGDDSSDGESFDEGDFVVFPIRVLFNELLVIGAYPAAKDAGGTWRRQCGGGDPEGLLLNAAFVSTARDATWSDERPPDRDNSLHPGDAVDFHAVDGEGVEDPEPIRLDRPEVFDLEVSCLDRLPDSNLGSCQGGPGSVELQASRHVGLAERRQGQNVVLLVDQSGSMSGLVERSTFTESTSPDVPTDFAPNASDRNNIRLTAAKRFTQTLNEEDRLGVLAFGEGLAERFRVPCASSDVNGLDAREKLDTCFGRDRDLWMPPPDSRHAYGGIDELGSGVEGRANLWEAVDLAYDFLRDRDDRDHPNHIVVVTDGPDTCTASGDATPCETPCSDVTFEDVRDRVLSDQEAGQPPIHVHFVQFEAPGYPGRDPRQVEIACESLGHYQFINSNAFSDTQLAAFQQALEQAMLNVRSSLMGWWQLAAGSEGLKRHSAQPGGTPKGAMYALSGTLTVRASSNLVDTDEPFAFGVGQGAGARDARQWDRRPTMRKACSSASDCGATSEPGACREVCSASTGLCLDGSEPVSRPDGAPCEDGGICCDGACQPSGTVCSACQ